MCGLVADHVDTAGPLNVTSTCNVVGGVSPAETE
jgi:hypothetical protein